MSQKPKNDNTSAEPVAIDYTKRHDEGAEQFMDKYVSIQNITPHRPDVLKHAFKAGADWSRAEAQADLALTRKMADALVATHEREIERLKADNLLVADMGHSSN